MVAAWYWVHMEADSKMTVGLIHGRIGVQEVEAGLKMSYARMLDVGEHTVMVVANKNFVVADNAPGLDEQVLDLGYSRFFHRDNHTEAVL